MRKDFSQIDADLGHVPVSSQSTEENLPPIPPLSAYIDEFDKGDAPGVRESQFFPASDFFGKDVPERSWVSEGLIPGSTVTLLGGDGGTGKSLLSLQLAVAMATGRKWLGRTVASGPVLYMSAEDDTDELHRRLADIVRAEDIGLDELDRLSLRSLAGEDALLAFSDARTGTLHASPLMAEVARHAADLEPALIVLDTLADLFPGNENDRAQARQFIGLLRGLALQNECAVLLLSHPSLSGISSGTGSSGSTGWNNSVRSRLYFSRLTDEGYEADPDARVLRTMKANYGRVGDEIAVQWRDGIFVAQEAETSLDRVAKNAKSERVFLKILDAFIQQGRYVSPNPSVSYAPTVFARHPDAEGITKIAFTRAMESLLQTGQIGIAEHGRGASKKQHLEVKNA